MKKPTKPKERELFIRFVLEPISLGAKPAAPLFAVIGHTNEAGKYSQQRLPVLALALAKQWRLTYEVMDEDGLLSKDPIEKKDEGTRVVAMVHFCADIAIAEGIGIGDDDAEYTHEGYADCSFR